MTRDVSAHLELNAAGAARAVLAIAVARGYVVEESLVVTQAGRVLPWVELDDAHGTRLHDVAVGEGRVEVEYRATITGEAPLPDHEATDIVRYLRPSRYAQSDLLTPEAVERFGDLEPAQAIEEVAAWVNGHVAYAAGTSLPTDAATSTLLSRQGVCRDFAHLTAGFLRAVDVPARVVAVYAPGLDPMDFHAVVEAWADGSWWVVDATRLAPRESMVRIATGRDAADNAFLTTIGAPVTLDSMTVMATVDALPAMSDGLVRLR